jgi:hypothetical protein
MRGRVASMAPLLIAAGGAWLTAGTVSPIGGDATARLAVLPPLWLALALLAAAVPAAMLPFRTSRLHPLYLSVLLWLPWLPLAIPVSFLLWHGPLASAVWIVIAALLLAPFARARWARALAAPPARQFALAIVIAAATYTAAAWRMAPAVPAGDEPHYLVITQSLLYDRDLRIENNHRRGDYHAYFGADLKPDYLRRGVDGEIYSIHAPGLPALVLPAFALAGYPGVVVFLAIVSAMGAALVWRTGWRITGDAGAAWAGWAAVALTAPFLFHSFTLYPDGPAAALVMAAIYALSFPDAVTSSRWRIVALGSALAYLPWLHTRYAVLAAILGVLVVWQLWRPGEAGDRSLSPRLHRLGRCVTFLAVPALSAAVWLWSFYAIYGELNPTAPYGGYTQSSLRNVPRGLAGLLVDQQFGVLPNAPVYLVAFFGMVALWRARRRLAIDVLLVAMPYAIAVTCYHMWWGGHSSPGRFIVPVLLPFGIGAAAQWARSTRRGRQAFAVLLGTSIAVALALVWVEHGALVYSFRDGFSRWMDRAAPLVNLPRAVPTLFGNTRDVTAAMVGAWAAAATASWLLARFVRPVGNEDSGTRWWFALACTLMVGATLGWRIAGAAPIESGTGLLRVARAAAVHGEVMRLPDLRSAAGARAFAHVRVPSGLRRDRPADGLLFVARDLPAGRYRVMAGGAGTLAGMLEATVGRRTAPHLQTTLDGTPPGPTPMVLDLPAGAQVLTISGDATASRSIQEVSLQVEAFGGNPDQRVARRVARYGEALVWFLDDAAFVEGAGWWVGGRATAAIVLDRPRSITPGALLVRNGAVPNRVRLTAAAWTVTLDLTPGEERSIDVPTVAGRAWLQTTSEAGFRPHDVDPGSSDVRVLGVWVQVR